VDEQDRYRAGRGELLLNARKVHLQETYSGLTMRFEALAPDLKQAVAEQALFGSYEGTEQQLERDIRALLDEDAVDARALAPMIERARRNAEHADHPVARVVADLLVEQLLALQAEARGDTTMPPQDEATLRDLIRERGVPRLFPKLAEALGQAEDARERLKALIYQYPQRMEPLPDGHVRGDALASMRNFLTLGIKIGTDKKTRAAVQGFARREGRLNKIMDTLAPGNRLVDYGKGTARRLNAGTYNHEEAKQRLAHNPTLAAQLMAAAGDELLNHDPTVLGSAAHPQQRPPQPTTADAQARARELHEQARRQEPAITQQVLDVAQSCGAQRRDAGRTLRSQDSLRGELRGAREGSGGAWKAPLTLRYSLQLQPDGFVEGFRQAMLGFEERGFAKVQVNNSFNARDPMFMGVNVVLEAEGGFRFSVQFHTEDSHRVKGETHDVHKQLQAERANAEPDAVRVEQLQQTLRRACEPVPRPPGVQTIRNWHVDPHEGPRMRRATQPAPRAGAQTGATTSAARGLQAQARAKEAQITPVMASAAAAIGAQLRGNATFRSGEDRVEDNATDRHLKSVESIKQALKRLDEDGQRGAQATLRDALRYALVLRRERFVDGVERARQRLREAGMQLVREDDFFATAGIGGYRGLNTTWRDATGYEYSVQFHTPESFEAKARAHVHYKVMQSKTQRLRRELAKETPDAQKVDELQQAIDTQRARSEQVFATVHPPPSA